VFVLAQYGGGDLPFRCGNAELSPPSGDGFLTKLGADHACAATGGVPEAVVAPKEG